MERFFAFANDLVRRTCERLKPLERRLSGRQSRFRTGFSACAIVIKLTRDARNPPMLCLLVLATSVIAAPSMPPGDSRLRSDIQTLSAWGVLTGPVTTWPLSWYQVEADLVAYSDDHALPAHVARALGRVRSRMTDALYREGSAFGSRAALSGTTTRMRSFEHVPRDEAEISARLDWSNERIELQLAATAVNDPLDGETLRADGSLVGLSLGNYTIAASLMDRWWGPGWDSSLVLSTNARPIPALAVDRSRTAAFESPWLRWIGPWDLSVMAGWLESERHVPGARFLGMRLVARPHQRFEVALSRTAMWCGDGRPCDADTFYELFRGNDNRGDSGVSEDNEPGNQLAGIDVRWTLPWLRNSISVYGQFIGEDEAGGLPSRYLGQVGVEHTGALNRIGSYRWFAEYAGTSCDFYKRSEIFNCAYNHAIYQTGYRYRGRTIGHAADNDAKVISAGVFVFHDDVQTFQGLVRAGRLNRYGPPDPRHTLTPVRQDLFTADLIYGRTMQAGRLQIGVGYDYRKDIDTGTSESGARAFVELRSGAWF